MASSQLSQDELDAIYAFAVDLGRKAGDFLMKRVEKRISGIEGNSQKFDEKDNAVDIVTQTDEDVEVFIRNTLQAKYPEHKFLGEETYAKGQSRDYLIDEKPTWCIDPLDGTVNYTHLFPMFCISIGFIVNHRPVIGVIYAPFQDQLFSACRGRGAWLNEKRQLPLIRKPSIPPMPVKAPSQCIFSCEWGKDRRDIPDGNMHRKVESFVNMAAEVGGRNGKGGMVHGMRSLGSAALDLAYTAMGSFDIWWEAGCWEWDVAAGIAILLEAGGLVTTANPPRTRIRLRLKMYGLGADYIWQSGRLALQTLNRAASHRNALCAKSGSESAVWNTPGPEYRAILDALEDFHVFKYN